ncbi:MAG: preprotein translocase subunit YajC [bacterium]|nr:preprotein translocase subunit YajC [bacterium]
MGLNSVGMLALAPSGAEGGGMSSILMPMILIFGIFYFLLIAPERKKQKKRVEMINNLKPGDKIITNGGIYGTVVGIADETMIQVRIADQVKIEVARHAIAGLQGAPE